MVSSRQAPFTDKPAKAPGIGVWGPIWDEGGTTSVAHLIDKRTNDDPLSPIGKGGKYVDRRSVRNPVQVQLTPDLNAINSSAPRARPAIPALPAPHDALVPFHGPQHVGGWWGDDAPAYGYGYGQGHGYGYGHHGSGFHGFDHHPYLGGTSAVPVHGYFSAAAAAVAPVHQAYVPAVAGFSQHYVAPQQHFAPQHFVPQHFVPQQQFYSPIQAYPVGSYGVPQLAQQFVPQYGGYGYGTTVAAPRGFGGYFPSNTYGGI